MGFFDKILATANVSLGKPVINNEQEAFLTMLTASGSADGDIEGDEWDTIYDTLFISNNINKFFIAKVITNSKCVWV